MLIDTHAHLYVEQFAEDLSGVIQRTKDAAIEKVLLPNIDVSTIAPLKKIVAAYPMLLLPMMGLHPTSVKANYKEDLALIYKELSMHNDYIAIGEIGIDLYWDTTFFEEQKDAFEQQLEWSIEKKLPVAIHARNSYREVIESIKRVGAEKLRGVFHSFSGDSSELKELVAYENFYIGINGIITFKNSNLREIIKDCPINRIVLETDAPYLAPTPYRGKRNEPSYLTYINQTLAEVYNIDYLEVAQTTRANAMRLFGISL